MSYAKRVAEGPCVRPLPYAPTVDAFVDQVTPRDGNLPVLKKQTSAFFGT
jgi:hypothetical protein